MIHSFYHERTQNSCKQGRKGVGRKELKYRTKATEKNDDMEANIALLYHLSIGRLRAERGRKRL